MDEVTQQYTRDILLCPIRAWAKIVSRVRNIPGSTDDTFVNSFFDNGRCHHVTGDDVKTALRAAATIIGEDRLGFKPHEVGTHSIRSGAAMAMYLDEVPVYSIMLMGRWLSDAFLRYIRKQVVQFSNNIAQ